jgi:hypothetical protein
MSNEERRRHHKAQDPDQPHRFRGRKLTTAKAADDYIRWYAKLEPRPCHICGGSSGDWKHL